ncbi:MAG TPA: hypothetical protein VEL75_02550, partial [Candidatus Methylomirabilis sp.]|nr:hypothetical protein [Candidatus Methylomirabilis sp.]
MSGGAHPEGARLAPSDLAARLDRILAAGQRLIAPVPGPALRYSRPPGGRTVRDHAFGMFRLGLAFADAMDMGGFR